jgi:hypothetical protein
VLCRISIGTRIPKSNVFRFENYWASHGSFLSTVESSWNKCTASLNNSVSVISAKFKRLRYDLRQWSKGLSNIKLLIENCNKVIKYLDTIEEFRSLFNPEWNLRNIIKKKLCSLLENQAQYWKQRNTVNRIKYGDECTKYFHSMATVNYRRNLIAQVQDDYGVSLIQHEDKANYFWCSFKNRMGISNKVTMEFDLSSLVPVSSGDVLDNLVAPILRFEVDNIIKRMPADKAPGPDGFNGVFIKKMLAHNQRRYLQTFL